MKTFILRCIFSILCVFAFQLKAQDLSANERIKQVEQEYIKRRQAREEAYSSSLLGGVFQPVHRDDAEVAVLEIDNLSVRECAQTYATLIDKEVMVSARVASKRISVKIRRLNRREAGEALVHALEAAGVTVVTVADSTVALVETSALTGEPRKPTKAR